MPDFLLIPQKEFLRVVSSCISAKDQFEILGDMTRINILTAIKKAGSGHIGTSLSSVDIMVYLYFYVLNVDADHLKNPERDIFFSSKGHDAPALYSVLFAKGIVTEQQITNLRRLDGLPGHPDVMTSGIEANTGSLGMGISKAKGFAFSKRLKSQSGEIYVLTGDGEWQEGQIYESLQTAVYQKLNNITVLMDHNKIQSDKQVEDIISLGDLEKKISDFGWHVTRCDGHSFDCLENVFKKSRLVNNKPKAIILDTVKGKGVSFMEHPYDLPRHANIYQWHSGAPQDEAYVEGVNEILGRLNNKTKSVGLRDIQINMIPKDSVSAGLPSRDHVAQAYGKALVSLGHERKELVVLDADLAADCCIRGFEREFPDRFIENGIAEQDMVSMAGGLALAGLLPVVNSFACFLSARAAEQIYTNACERTKIIYACHFAGLTPSAPGASHQSVRDMALFASLPHMAIYQPCNGLESEMILRHAVNAARTSVMIRLQIGYSPEAIQLPSGYQFVPGQGCVLQDGLDAALLAYGPVMLGVALAAADFLRQENISVKVINCPCLNDLDQQWWGMILEGIQEVYVIEDHYAEGGVGQRLRGIFRSDHNKNFTIFAPQSYLACGTLRETLEFHGLDAKSIAKQIINRHKCPVYDE